MTDRLKHKKSIGLYGRQFHHPVKYRESVDVYQPFPKLPYPTVPYRTLPTTRTHPTPTNQKSRFSSI